MGFLREVLRFAVCLAMIGITAVAVIVLLAASKYAHDKGLMLNMVLCWFMAFAIVCFGGAILSRLLDWID